MQKIHRVGNIFRYFFKNIPFNLLISIFVSLLTQLFVILSYFLPIKVIILINGDSLPHYLTSIFPNFEKNEIILILTFLIFIFYGISILLEKYGDKLTLASMRILMHNPHIVIRPNNKLIYKYINSFLKFISTLFFLTFMLLLLFYLFPAMAMVLVGYLLFIYLLFTYSHIHNKYYGTFFKLTSGIGFMFIFIYEIVDVLYLHTQETSLLIILLSAVFARYIFMRGYYMVNQLLFVYSNTQQFHKRINELVI